jgi:hypothetical protein
VGIGGICQHALFAGVTGFPCELGAHPDHEPHLAHVKRDVIVYEQVDGVSVATDGPVEWLVLWRSRGR